MSEQREIKFRVWYGQTMQYSDHRGEELWEMNIADLFQVYANGQFMQFTGLKDKNGKEIYEGDILNVHLFTQELGESLGVREGEREFKAEICFQELGLWINGNTEEESGYLLWFDGIHEESYEVVGNIYENPELLTP